MPKSEHSPITFIDSNGIKFNKDAVAVLDSSQKQMIVEKPSPKKKTGMHILQLNDYGKVEKSTIE